MSVKNTWEEKWIIASISYIYSISGFANAIKTGYPSEALACCAWFTLMTLVLLLWDEST